MSENKRAGPRWNQVAARTNKRQNAELIAKEVREAVIYVLAEFVC